MDSVKKIMLLLALSAGTVFTSAAFAHDHHQGPCHSTLGGMVCDGPTTVAPEIAECPQSISFEGQGDLSIRGTGVAVSALFNGEIACMYEITTFETSLISGKVIGLAWTNTNNSLTVDFTAGLAKYRASIISGEAQKSSGYTSFVNSENRNFETVDLQLSVNKKTVPVQK